jgi:hypothetical protein
MTDTKPVAWHFQCDEYESVTLLKQHADAMAEFYNTTPIPLYYAPTLADEEREAILNAARIYELDSDEEECAAIATTLRHLLERMK